MCFQPIRDCMFHLKMGNDFSSRVPGAKTQVDLGQATTGLVNQSNAQRNYNYAASIIFRVALAAIGTFALINSAPAIALAVGALVSLPTTLIAVGAMGMYYGTAGVIASLATGSFATLGMGLLALAGGYLCIQNYMIFRFGILELCLPKTP